MAGKGGARPGKRVRGPHLKRRENGIWYAYVARGDVRSLDTRDEKQARERFRAIAAELPELARAARDRAETLEAIADAYVDAPHGWTPRSRRGIVCRVNAFIEAMGALSPPITKARQVTARALDTWRTGRLTEVSRATVNRDEGVVTRMAAWAEKAGMWPGNPFRTRVLVKEPRRPRARVIHSPAQVTRMVAWALGEAGARTKAKRYPGTLEGWALTAAALEATGFRIDEARMMSEAWLTRTGVTLMPEAGVASEAWTSKGYKPREIALSAESIEVLRRFIAWRDEPHGKQKRSGVSEGWFAEQADRAAEATGAPKTYRPHDARRRWVTELHRAGVPLKTISHLVGHADVQTTERYVCTYYDDAAVIAVPTPGAVAAFSAPTASVIPMRAKASR